MTEQDDQELKEILTYLFPDNAPVMKLAETATRSSMTNQSETPITLCLGTDSVGPALNGLNINYLIKKHNFTTFKGFTITLTKPNVYFSKVSKLKELGYTSLVETGEVVSPLRMYNQKTNSYLHMDQLHFTYASTIQICSDEANIVSVVDDFINIFRDVMYRYPTSESSVTEFYFDKEIKTKETQYDVANMPSIYDELYPDIDCKSLVEDYLSSDESLLFLYGEPGVGKTTFIKKLLYQSVIKDAAYVKDPTILNNAAFWVQLGSEYQILILDDLDCDFTRPRDSNEKSKHFLNFLLSYSDGILSMGRRPKILITTNQTIQGVDSALVRAGRCFDFIHVKALNQQQALHLWTTKFNRTEEEFNARFNGITKISQSSFMMEINRLDDKKDRRRYIKDPKEAIYSIESKMKKLGIKISTAIGEGKTSIL